MNHDLLNMLKLKHMNRAEDGPESELSRRIRRAEHAMPASVLDGVTKQLADMLPAAEKKYGPQHATYLFYVDLLMVCLWCNRYIGIVEDAQLRLANAKLENVIIREQLLQAEKELNRYTTTEEILMSGTMDMYMRTVMNSIAQVVPDHPRVVAFAQALELIDPKERPSE